MTQAERGLFERIREAERESDGASNFWERIAPICADFEQRLAEAERDAELYQFLKTHNAMHPTKPHTEYGICELTFDAHGKQLSAFWVGAGDVEASLAVYKNRTTAPLPRFAMVYCSQCGEGLGPGDAGISHCSDHTPLPEKKA